MPKQNHIIPRFNGLILDIAKENLPDGVFANNTRNAHFDESGNLIGFTPPAGYLTSGISSVAYAGKYKAPDGSRLFHIEDTSPARLKTYLPGSTSVLSKDMPHTNLQVDKLSHVQRLNHMVIGTGNGQANKPVWYGKHNHVQFGNAAPAEPQCHDAELVSPTQLSSDNYFPVARDVVRTGDNTFMISPDTSRVFKFDGTTKVDESPDMYQNPAVICADSTSGFFWLYDQQAKAVYRLNSNMVIQNTVFLTGFPDDDKIVIDMVVAAGNLWFLRSFVVREYTAMENWLYRTPRTTSSSASQQVVNAGFVNFPRDAFGVNEGAGALSSYPVEPWQAKFGNRGLFVKSNTLYVAFQIQVDWWITEEGEWDPELQETRGGMEFRLSDLTSFYLRSKDTGAPMPSGSRGNMVIIPIDPDQRGVSNENIDLITGNQSLIATDWIAYDSNRLELFNYTHNNTVTRMNFPMVNINGDSHLSPIGTNAITGFVSNDVQPVLVSDSNTSWFFSRNAPAKAGILSDATVSSIVESIASLALKPIPGGFSEDDKVYYYAFSFLYDGYMESPLSDSVSARASEGSGFTITLQVPDDNINRRVSALNIYRAAGSAYGREEFFRIVDSVSLDFGFPLGSVDGQDVRIIEYNDRKAEFELGPAFNSNSGIPETMENNIVHYGLSTMIDEYMFAADCWHPKLPEAPFMLFRSQPFSICSFNWETDVLRLPTRPIAMASHNNRLYVFDEHDMHVVDPANLVIEHRVDGLGAVNARSVKEFTGGLVIAGNRHVSILSGGGTEIPSKRISLHPGADLDGVSMNPGLNSKNTLRDYRYLVENATNFHLSIDENRKEIYILGTISGATLGYVYNFETQQWSRYLRSSYSLFTSVDDGRGNLLAYRSSQVDYLFGSASPQPGGSDYVAELVPFDGDDANIDKWYYEVRVDYQGSTSDIAVRVAADSQDYSAELSETPALSGTFVIPDGNHRQGKTLRIRLEGSVKVKSISLIYRPKQVRS